MKRFTILLCTLSVLSCKKGKESFMPRSISTVEIETLMEDSLLNVRALEIYDKSLVYFATSTGKIGAMNVGETPIDLEYEHLIEMSYDTIVPNFRSLGGTFESGFVMSIGSPALLFRIGTESEEVVYKEVHPKAFYDSMEFWNNEEGIAIGDAIDGCLSIIITRDGGSTWTKLSCNDLPAATENEGAFAASDTNIAIVGDKTWVATTAGRIYYSADKGNSWRVNDTPIVKDKETEGIYSIDFYDENNGFGIGGDYLKPEENVANKIRTSDGGKTWEVVGEGKEPGYRSCVQYIPNREGKELVSLGFKGIDYSNDSGTTWTHLSDEGFYTIRFVNDSVAYAAGKGRISKLTFRE